MGGVGECQGFVGFLEFAFTHPGEIVKIPVLVLPILPLVQAHQQKNNNHQQWDYNFYHFIMEKKFVFKI